MTTNHLVFFFSVCSNTTPYPPTILPLPIFARSLPFFLLTLLLLFFVHLFLLLTYLLAISICSHASCCIYPLCSAWSIYSMLYACVKSSFLLFLVLFVLHT
ncbi:hypothetical protein F5H01DRAFT_347179 [Linnemannia elongata]|nr:hypothetical protein F5H01DRAFT_347179 [Linnemannia elongata]